MTEEAEVVKIAVREVQRAYEPDAQSNGQKCETAYYLVRRPAFRQSLPVKRSG